MYQGKYRQRPQRRGKRLLLLLLSLVLLVNVSIFGTMAFLSTNTGSVQNTFTATPAPNEVVETFNGTVKRDVKIKNTSETTEYIRAAVIVTWADGAGNISSTLPVEGTDYTITWPEASNWALKKDETTGMTYYYYTQIVDPGMETGVLFTACQMKEGITPPEGYKLSVEIMGQSIQARGKDSAGVKPVELAWGLGPETLS